MSKHSKMSRRGYITYGAFGSGGRLIDTNPITQVEGVKVEREESKATKKNSLREKIWRWIKRIYILWSYHRSHWFRTKIFKTKKSV